jgi:hypothetical protein
MGCLCKKISCQACNPCDASFEDAFKNLKCNLEVIIGACTKEGREKNDTILWMLYDVLCRLRGSICPSDELINLATQYQFFDNLINDDFVIASDIVFDNLTFKNIRVFLNGQRIYHIDEQTSTGIYVYDFNANTGKISLFCGPMGWTTPGDPLPTGTTDNPSYISVETDKLLPFSDLLKCS